MKSWGWLIVGVFLLFSATMVVLYADSVDVQVPDTSSENPNAMISDHEATFVLGLGLFGIGGAALLTAGFYNDWGNDCDDSE
jgi:hypothetical protein